MNSDVTTALWRKSTKSQSNGACVEVAALTSAIAVRDSKDPAGPALSFERTAWSAFAGFVTNRD